MRRYATYWRDGGREVIEGANVGDALIREGYTQADMNNLQAYDRDYKKGYFWQRDLKSWTMQDATGSVRELTEPHNLRLDFWGVAARPSAGESRSSQGL